MLTRDAAFNVYRMMLRAPSKAYEKMVEEEKKKAEAAAEELKKAESVTEGEDAASKGENGTATIKEADGGEQPMETDEGKDDVKEIKEKKPSTQATISVVRDSVSFLAFTHFDSKHLGYITMKDAEQICYSLGLHLTRSQVSD